MTKQDDPELAAYYKREKQTERRADLRRMRTEFLRAEAPGLICSMVQEQAALLDNTPRSAANVPTLAVAMTRILWSAIYPEESAELAELEKKV